MKKVGYEPSMLDGSKTLRGIARIKPGPGQESVWDYPRPPLVQPTTRHIEIVFGETRIVDTVRALRVLETSHPPVYYIPLDDVSEAVLLPSGRSSYCEFKGEARYYHVSLGERKAKDAAWLYPSPALGYEVLAGHVAFYARAMDECRIDGIVAHPQPGTFYGGWITPDVVGPFKGETGVSDW